VYSRIFLIMGQFTNGEDDVVDIIDQAPQVLIACEGALIYLGKIPRISKASRL